MTAKFSNVFILFLFFLTLIYSDGEMNLLVFSFFTNKIMTTCKIISLGFLGGLMIYFSVTYRKYFLFKLITVLIIEIIETEHSNHLKDFKFNFSFLAFQSIYTYALQ